MKLRTSYFNTTVLRKDITRFAPVWGLYTVFLLLVLIGYTPSGPSGMASFVRSCTTGMSVINLLYAGICGILLFGDLFNSRMCNALHAFPMRREGWFLTHLTAGLLFCLVPNTLAAVISCIHLQQYSYMALFWLTVAFLQYLFFFGAASVSALCAGNRFSMAVIYALGNFLPLLVYYLAEIFYVPLLYGVQTELSYFTFFSPCIEMAGAEYVNFTRYFATFEGFFADQWCYLFAVAGIGVLLMGLSVLIYRRRKLESAGDFISLRPLYPVFLVIYTIGVGAVMHALAYMFANHLEYLFLVIGMVIGFFTGRMLLDRTVKVFRPKAFLGLLLLIVAFGLSLFVTKLDPLGITRRIPALRQVDSVTISTSPNYSYTYGGLTLDKPEDIQTILDMHDKLAENHVPDPGDPSVKLYIEYTLRSGGSLRRYYPVYVESTDGKILNSYFSSWECVFKTDDWEAFKKSVGDIYADDLADFPSSAYTELLDALYLDCEAGNMSQIWRFHEKEDSHHWIDILTYDEDRIQTNYITLQIYDSCTNTIAVLEKYSSKNTLN